MAGRYKQPVQYGKGPPIKAGQPEPSLHLGTACEIHHIYEDLNESSSARPGRSQQLEIPPSLNSKQAACFSSPVGFSLDTDFLPGAGISTPARILSPAWFSVDARISQIRLIFCKSKDFSIRLIFCRCKDFSICLIFGKSRDFSIRLIFSSCMYLYIFQYFIFCIEYAPYYLAQLFKIDTVVIII